MTIPKGAGQPPLEIVPVRSPHELGRFIALADRLSRNDPAYIAPLHDEQRTILNPRKNPYFEHAEAAYWLACRGGRDVGRISAQRDHHLADPAGHFGMLAAEDDPEVFAALLRTVEEWHRAEGRNRVIGPFSISVNDPMGVLVDGFETPPMLLMGHDLPYVGARLEEQGYRKEKDLLAYLYDSGADLPPSVRRLIDRPLPEGLVIRPLDMKRYASEVKTVSELFNDAWSENWGFVPLSEAETDMLAKQLRMLLNEKLIWFAEFKGEPVGFIVTLPNLNEAIRDLNGKLLPLGWAKLLWRLKVKGVHTARVVLMGVRRQFAKSMVGSLVPFLLVDAVMRETRKLGLNKVELSWILEDNMPMRRINEAVGGVVYKTYRMYAKDIAPLAEPGAAGETPAVQQG